jgi:hypothetical protein
MKGMRYAFKSVDLYAPIDARIDLLGHHRSRNRGARRYAAHHHGFERSGLWVLHRLGRAFTPQRFHRHGRRDCRPARPSKCASACPRNGLCHAAEIAGYVIEGHVPAQAIRRLIAERPDALGLAVPGMPVGSPGMEGGTPEIYDVILFGKRPPMSFGRFIGDRPV